MCVRLCNWESEMVVEFLYAGSLSLQKKRFFFFATATGVLTCVSPLYLFSSFCIPNITPFLKNSYPYFSLFFFPSCFIPPIFFPAALRLLIYFFFVLFLNCAFLTAVTTFEFMRVVSCFIFFF
ncbi:hypothetical protein, unlikely [Trypanosoma brucei gambiense DAL972]|uniref:Uncharacterized protein n=1 Tax=Trypanosoma brucei gambiense (strain MHOM/CI/86/DAL972) TaxID=679716 RepID=D0A2R9_TRYB9|nr:hypothetical protein, unlikely [Trypanosoma brucei gambiense DAL972]CBH15563.1 hypothetical protein, unlikely [Trypanosoma brucei gambiense DAL972]|eukprot:XP_011777827.1 hypothetical protein, unlikely [Trypanosoma brucei gambiense DAL972]